MWLIDVRHVALSATYAIALRSALRHQQSLNACSPEGGLSPAVTHTALIAARDRAEFPPRASSAVAGCAQRVSGCSVVSVPAELQVICLLWKQRVLLLDNAVLTSLTQRPASQTTANPEIPNLT